MKVLNLHACLGGNRKLWKNCEVTAVEKNPLIAEEYRKKYPDDELIIGCAMEYLKEHRNKFDFIWASPPCPKHSRMMKATRHDVADYFDLQLYQIIIFLTHFFDGKWCVENVIPYYEPLIKPQKIGRHCYWANFIITPIKLPEIKDMSRALRKDMVEYLGFDYDGNIYIGNNHCPTQILRNCTHPLEGNHIFNLARGIIIINDTNQGKLF